MAKYLEIYQTILSYIENGTYPANTLLPSENDLMKQYNVSRDTIRKSLTLLSQYGYIQKQHGLGSIVLDIHRFDFPVSGVVSFKELSPSLGSRVETDVIALVKTHPDRRMQEILQLKEEEYVWLLQRVRKIDGEAVILDTDFINTKFVPQLDSLHAKDSLYAYLEEELHLKISYAEKEITCLPKTNMDDRWLNMKGYDMIVNVESKTYLDNASIFQYTISRHRPDKFKFKEFARRIKAL